MNSTQGSVFLQEAIGCKGSSNQIENCFIKARGGILQNKYQKVAWDSYRGTINQMIQFYTPKNRKYCGSQYFEKL